MHRMIFDPDATDDELFRWFLQGSFVTTSATPNMLQFDIDGNTVGFKVDKMAENNHGEHPFRWLVNSTMLHLNNAISGNQPTKQTSPFTIGCTPKGELLYWHDLPTTRPLIVVSFGPDDKSPIDIFDQGKGDAMHVFIDADSMHAAAPAISLLSTACELGVLGLFGPLADNGIARTYDRVLRAAMDGDLAPLRKLAADKLELGEYSSGEWFKFRALPEPADLLYILSNAKVVSGHVHSGKYKFNITKALEHVCSYTPHTINLFESME